VIESYLTSLGSELRVPRRARTRILAEVRDHLEEAVAAGVPAPDAVASFGDPHDLAARFHEQLASTSARRAGARTALLMVLLAVGVAAVLPNGIVVFLAAQLAVVAGGVGLVRWVRYRDGVPPDRLTDFYRPNGLAVACVAVVGLAERGIPGAVLLAASLVAGVSVARSRARARVVKAPVPADDALDDLAAVIPLEPVRRVGSLLRVHPWLFCLAFAGACGLALAGQHALVEGGLVIGWRQALAALVITSIEATAVIVCFAAFGRLLGIRR
jgi:hypothetical protein